MIAPAGLVDALLKTASDAIIATDRAGIINFWKRGQRISVEFTIVMLKDEQDRQIGTAAILRDVTKQFEENRKLKSQLKGVAQVDNAKQA
jgi:hypothetical protein